MGMKFDRSVLIKLLLLQCLPVLSVAQDFDFFHLVQQVTDTAMSEAQDFDFFYFVQQWPGSYCDTNQCCCYPTTGKPPSDFGIHGLWPNYKNGTYPSYCDPDNPFDESKISDLISSLQENWASLSCPSNNGSTFWAHEWEKHGTCSESVLDQHGYFEAALDLKSRVGLLQILQSAGINPDGGNYSVSSIRSAITEGIGYSPWIACNVDAAGKTQLYEIYVCVDSSGSKLIECPVFPKGDGKCTSTVEFPTF
ncbi:UNVERIFIED_CONTAM: Extracellular ribonuclease LE [Sesamum radiatum]|uniref:Extracellular ribonuclease LE n=1 Tax=Sesamum radiatum TaxID=300843 RepID=A0AAW2N1V4_SESRA